MKELNRPKITDYGNVHDSDDYSLALHKYCDKIERERDELKEYKKQREAKESKILQELRALKSAVKKHINAGGFKQLQGESYKTYVKLKGMVK